MMNGILRVCLVDSGLEGKVKGVLTQISVVSQGNMAAKGLSTSAHLSTTSHTVILFSDDLTWLSESVV